MTAEHHQRVIDAYTVCTDLGGRTLVVPAGPASPGAWTLPGAQVRHGEHPVTTALRATAAQTGRQADLVRVRDVVAEVIGSGAAVHHDRVLFDATVSGDPTGPARWMSPDDLTDVPLPAFVAATLGVSAQPLPVAASRPSPGTADGPRRRQRFAAYALVTDPADRVLLTRIAVGFPGAGRWHLPGGGTDFGEAPVVGVLRELYEESGQHGRVVGVLGISHRRNPAALGPEGHPIDWHAVRVVYRVQVEAPTPPTVTETAGSTADAAWFDIDGLAGLAVTEVVGEATRALHSGMAAIRL
ncbi:MAG TPA: NUDIX domain-containing protein [Micromonosporaceae bacterium]|nr:NUDIX domain-containing protein [Micromonosporaceae bacterium]